MLDHSLRLTFRNFSTYFLIVATLAVPLHVGYTFVFQNVISVTELHDAIEDFPKTRQIRSVGPEQLRNARLVFGALTLVELLALPLLARAARRVLEEDAAGRMPQVTSAWAGVGRAGNLLGGLRARPGVIAVGALLALVVVVLAERIGFLLVEPLPDADAWAGVALVQIAARSLGAPFLVVPWAVASGEKSPERVVTPGLY
ncbi:MAG TPA: hypothetical protein VFS18_05075 [Actinomycetota bacterium]|nr:hypothetical protein [Actinomycetota bacterium]